MASAPSLRHGMAVLGLASLSACVVGPNYGGPPAVAPRAASAAPFVRASTASDITAASANGGWWSSLGDPALSALIATAATANSDIAVADARLRQSRALLRTRRADQLPTASLDASYARTRPSFAAFGVAPFGLVARDLDLYEASTDASWEIDLAGGRRRAVEAAVADLEAAQASRVDTEVRIASETAQAYVALRAAQRRAALTQSNLDVQGKLLALVQDRNRLGVASTLEVQRATAQLQSTRADLAPIKADIDVQLDRLAVLTGREPGAVDFDLSREAALPAPPPSIAVGDPAEALRRRPDVRVAERRIAAASARVGVATADLFPRVTLAGNVGFQTNSLGAINGQALNYSIGPSISWDFLNFGRVRARIDEANGRRDEAAASYQVAVLAALQDAEDALTRYGHAREETARRGEARDTAAAAAKLAEARYRLGGGSLLEALDAERDRVAAELALADAQARLTTAYVTLGKSLGLAWRAAPRIVEARAAVP